MRWEGPRGRIPTRRELRSLITHLVGFGVRALQACLHSMGGAASVSKPTMHRPGGWGRPTSVPQLGSEEEAGLESTFLPEYQVPPSMKRGLSEVRGSQTSPPAAAKAPQVIPTEPGAEDTGYRGPKAPPAGASAEPRNLLLPSPSIPLIPSPPPILQAPHSWA